MKTGGALRGGLGLVLAALVSVAAAATPTATPTTTPTGTSTSPATDTTTPTVTPSPTVSPNFAALATQTAVAAATQTAVASAPPAPGGGEGSYVYPDPVPRGVDAHLVYQAAPSASVRVRLFNAAGEAAGEVEAGPPSGGQVILPTAGFAPGVYLYLLEITDGPGPPQRAPIGHFVMGRR